MKKFLLKSLLVAVGLLTGGSAWAETSIGNVDGGWTTNNKEFTLKSNETLSLNFVVNATKNEQNYQGWVTQVLHGTDMIFFMQPSCGYAIIKEGVWNWENNTHLYNGNNYEWDGTSFRDNLQGATVVYSLKRINSEIILTEDVTTSDNSKHFRHFFVYEDANAEDDLKIVFGADAATLTITNVNAEDVITESEATELRGTLIGTLNNAKEGIKEQSFQTFPLAANGSLTLHFKNYTNKLQIWNNFVVEITDDTHFVDLRGDGGGWQWASDWGEYTTWWDVSNLTKTGYPATNYEYMEAMDGADVEVTITRSNETFNISATITPISGSAFSETYSFTDDNLTSNTVYVNLLCEGAHLDLLPVTTTIGTTGWTTFASSYALNLSNITATTGAVTAYYASAVGGGKVTMTSTEQAAVQAGEGFMLKGTVGATVSIPIVGSGTAITGNKLVGCTTETKLAKNNPNLYVLVNNGGKAEFQSLNTNGATIPAGKAYLNAAGASPVRSLKIAFEDAETGINEVNAPEAAANGYYNLAGQRVANPTKGLYIVNGKKVLVR